jgi:HEPN domain-containing protein
MPDRERVIEVVREWVGKAENDLMAAAYTLRIGAGCPTDTVCFHAQQCVEKYLKAVLVFHGREFPKVHDVAEILALLPVSARPAMAPAEARKLTVYATVTRYPGDYDPISLAEAREAVKLARRVRSAVRKRLPKEVLKQGAS